MRAVVEHAVLVDLSGWSRTKAGEELQLGRVSLRGLSDLDPPPPPVRRSPAPIRTARARSAVWKASAELRSRPRPNPACRAPGPAPPRRTLIRGGGLGRCAGAGWAQESLRLIPLKRGIHQGAVGDRIGPGAERWPLQAGIDEFAGFASGAAVQPQPSEQIPWSLAPSCTTREGGGLRRSPEAQGRSALS